MRRDFLRKKMARPQDRPKGKNGIGNLATLRTPRHRATGQRNVARVASWQSRKIFRHIILFAVGSSFVQRSLPITVALWITYLPLPFGSEFPPFVQPPAQGTFADRWALVTGQDFDKIAPPGVGLFLAKQGELWRKIEYRKSARNLSNKCDKTSVNHFHEYFTLISRFKT